VSAHGYKVGDVVRVVDRDDHGDPPIGTVLRIDDSTIPIRVDWDGEGGYWLTLDQIEPATATALVEATTVTGEMLAMSHGKAWLLRAAKTPRDYLVADGWFIREDGDWESDTGVVVELAARVAWLYNFEEAPSDDAPGWRVSGLDARTLRAFADLLDEAAVTP
jgi:hypothetical protein